MSKFKGSKGLFTYSVQKGSKNNCFMAQVFNDKGKSIAEIESTDNPEEATANAKLFSYAPEMLEALQDFINAKDEILKALDYANNMAEDYQYLFYNAEQLIKEATE